MIFPQILFDVEPESCKQIYDDGRSHGHKRDINEVKSHSASMNAHSLTKIVAHSKAVLFKKIL